MQETNNSKKDNYRDELFGIIKEKNHILENLAKMKTDALRILTRKEK